MVFMPNHQSNVDPPAALAVLPPVLVMVKREFFRVPILGRAMLLRGFIPVERKHRERAIAAVERAVESLKAGYSFLAYPEGTRSPDGRLQVFKKGVFVMAIKAQAPIVPVSSDPRKLRPVKTTTTVTMKTVLSAASDRPPVGRPMASQASSANPPKAKLIAPTVAGGGRHASVERMKM